MHRSHRLAPFAPAFLLVILVVLFALGSVAPATAEGVTSAPATASGSQAAASDTAAGAPAAEVGPGDGAGCALSTPNVVQELPAKRTATSRTYLLSDGTKQVEIFERPINYQDEKGAWQVIDPRLVPGGTAGVYESASTPVKVSVSLDKVSGRPLVSLACDGATVTLEAVDFPGMSLLSAPSVLGAKASFGSARLGPALAYEVIENGVKETITLSTPSSPNSYSFTLSHAGLTLKTDDTGQWGFYQKEATEPTLVLGSLFVYDSSVDETGSPAYAEGATMKVEPGEDRSMVTIHVPAEWLTDKERVFPVVIDPTVTQPAAVDTYVSSLYPNTAYGSATTMKVGYYDASTGWNRALVRFDLPADLTSGGGGYVISANLKLYQWLQYYAGQAMPTHVGMMTKTWSGSSTWNSLGTYEITDAKTISVAMSTWLDLSCADVVQKWASGTKPNHGFVVYQMPSEGQTYWRQFRSSEYTGTTYDPRLVINYTEVYDVKADYGATGNGTTDDTQSIQNAIDAAAAAGGGRVFFPAGTYRTTSALLLDASYVTLEGVGASSILKATGSGQTEVVLIGSDSAAVSGVSVKSLGIEVPDGGYGVRVTGDGGGNTIAVAYNTFTGHLVDNQSSGVAADANFGNLDLVGNDFSALGALPLNLAVAAAGRSVSGSTLPVSQSYRPDLLWGANRYDTAVRLSKAAYPNGAEAAVVVSGENYPDALAVAPLAVAYDGPTLLTYTSALTVDTANELQRLDPSQVFVVGLGSTIQNAVKQALPTATVTAIVGSDRYDTAARVAAQLKAKLGSIDRVVVVPGDNYPDGLSVGPLAAKKGWAILLTPAAGPLPTVTYTCYHTTLGVSSALEVGTSVALPDITDLTRIIGADRYDTSAQVADYAELLDGKAVFGCVGLATGNNFPDALAVGSYLGSQGGLLLLTNAETVTAPVKAELDGHFSWLDALSYVALPNLWATDQNSSTYLEPAPVHTTYEFPEFAGHDAAAVLDESRLDVTTVDLEIDSFGPTAALTRTYWSTRTAAGYFAPGWRFNFERALSFVDETLIRYTNEDGESFAFAKSGTSTSWSPPPGLNAKLAPVGSDWTLTFPESRLVLTFDGTSGRLKSEADRNGNAVTYAWTTTSVTITAANGQQIVVSLSDGKVTGAVYSTVDGTREVSYATAAPWSVTYYPNTSLAHTLTYSYNGEGRLSDLTAPAFTGTTDATQSFLYASGALSEVRFPDYTTMATFPDYLGSNADARATIAYNGQSAVVSRWGTVYSTGAPTGQTGTLVAQSFTWGSAGAPTSETEPGSQAAWTCDNSDLTRAPLDVSSPLGYSVSAGYDARMNVTSVKDELGHGETATYPTDPADPNADLPATITDALGSKATNTYDDHGNPTQVTRQLNAAGDLEVTRYTYADVTVGSATYYGALVQEQRLISGTPEAGVWAVTDYGDHYPNGQAGTTVYRDVALYDGQVDPPDLTITKTHDAFGNLLSETDTSSQVIATNTYDLAGRMLTSTGPGFTATVGGSGVSTQIVSHHAYDCWGHEVESYQTSTGDGSGEKDNWTTTVYDVVGRTWEVKRWLWASPPPSGTPQSTVSYRYDGLGRQITQADTTESGLPALTAYDARGNVVASWEGGVCSGSYVLARATRHLNANLTPAYDADGRVTATAEPGEGSTTFTYTPTGQVLTETRPDGTSTTYAYDAAGNKTQEASTEEGTTNFTYDRGGRCLTVTNGNSLTTNMTYDLLSRQTSAGAQGQPASQFVYNSLGWKLKIQDADGFTTSYVFDEAGRIVSETTAGNTTASTYDAAGHLTYQVDPGDRQTTIGYDLFGRESGNVQTLPGDPRLLVRDLSTTYDSLGRPVQSADGVLNLTHTYTYPQNTPTATTEVIGVGAAGTDLVSTTVTVAADGYETSRESVVTSSPQIANIVRTINTRDDARRVTKATLDAGAATDIYSQLSFDSAGHVLRQWGPDTGDGSGYLAAAATQDAYTYSSFTGLKTADNLQLQSVGTAAPIVSSYTYTSGGRLATATIGGVTETDTFDAAGNITSIGPGTAITYDSNRIRSMTVGASVTYFFFDPQSRWRTVQAPTDNESDPNRTTFSYTGTGRLAQYIEYANNVESLRADYTYDAQGQRTRSVVSTAGLVTTTDYAYEGLTLHSLKATQTGGASPKSWSVSYLYDESGDLYGGLYRDPAETSTPVFFGVVTTDRGDVVELLDANGSPFAAYRYDAWGNPQGTGNLATGIWTQTTSLITDPALAADIATRQVLRYATYCYDAENGMYYLSARHYDPGTRQFLSKDLSRNDGEESAYQYCAGNPVKNVDPTGYKPSVQQVKKMGKRLNQFSTSFKNGGRDVLRAVGSALGRAGRAIGSAFGAAGRAIGTAAKKAGQAIWGALKWTGTKIKQAGQWVARQVKKVNWRKVGLYAAAGVTFVTSQATAVLAGAGTLGWGSLAAWGYSAYGWDITNRLIKKAQE
jgi:RHS repeat-associated protein